MRNGGTLAGLADDDVVEVPARVGPDGPVALAQAPLAPELLGLAQHVAAYERLAVRAALSGDPVDARKALLAHPLIGQDEMAGELVERLLAGAGAMSGRVVLAVDGGNSKTDLALLREDGAVLALVRGGHQLAAPHRARRLRRAARASCSRRRARRPGSTATRAPTVGHLLLAGLDLPVEERALHDALAGPAGRDA